MREVNIIREKQKAFKDFLVLIYCDDQVVASIRDGETVSFCIIEEKHHVVNAVTYHYNGRRLDSDAISINIGKSLVNLRMRLQEFSIVLEIAA